MEPDKFYHIYNRGNNSQRVFLAEDDYKSFLLRWKKYIEPVAETWAYNLLGNHFHAVIRIRELTEPKTVDRAFANFFIAFARTLQLRHGINGALFHRAFKKKPVLDEDQLCWVIGYTLTNQTHHNPSADFRDAPHSSFKASFSDKPTLLPRERLYLLYGGKDAFLQFLFNQARYYGFQPDWED